MRNRTHSRRRGFTLIELLIVLGVIAITMAIGGPALWKITSEIKLKNAAREAVSGMRMARYRAINESGTFGFSAIPGGLSTSGGVWESPGLLRLFEGSDPNDVNAIIRDIEIPGGVAVASSEFGNTLETFVVFSPDGSAGAAGTIVLENNNHHIITVSLGPASTARMQISKIEQRP